MVADHIISSIENVEKSDDSSLVLDRKIRVPKLPSESQQINDESPAQYRFRLQGLARELLGASDHRLSGCMRRLSPMVGHAEIRRDPENDSAHFRNLEQCNRVWTCPVCSARISNIRRKELSVALAAAKLKGLFPVLVTYTLRHDGRDELTPLLSGLLDALRLYKSGRAYQTIKDEFSIIGGIRALEMTYGENGWHPHVHELLFLEKPISIMQVAGLRKHIITRWLESLRKLAFDASYAHGVDVRTADSKIADYIAKFGCEPRELSWGVENEIASAPHKKAHRDGLTPFQLLESYDIGDKRAERLFIEYGEAMQRHHQLSWSRGLRALLKMPEELEDQALPGFEETPAAYTAVLIDRENWNRVLLFDLRGALLYLVAQGDWSTLQALLRKYVIEAEIHMNPPAEIMDKVLTAPPAAGCSDNSPPTQETLFPPPPIKMRYE